MKQFYKMKKMGIKAVPLLLPNILLIGVLISEFKEYGLSDFFTYKNIVIVASILVSSYMIGLLHKNDII